MVARPTCHVFRLSDNAWDEREFQYSKLHDEKCAEIDWRPEWSVDCIEYRELEELTFAEDFDL